MLFFFFFFFQAEDGIRDSSVTEFRRVLFRSLAGGERRLAVGAAIGERGGGPVPRAKDDQRLVADRPRQRLGAGFGGSCGGVTLYPAKSGPLGPPPAHPRTPLTITPYTRGRGVPAP